MALPEKKAGDNISSTLSPDDVTTTGKRTPAPKLPSPPLKAIALLVLTLGGLALGYWAGANFGLPKARSTAPLTPEQLAAEPDAAKPLAPGPWGNLEYLPIYIEPPEEYIPIESIERADRRWRFDGFTYDQLSALFQKADLTDAQRADLMDMSKWSLENGALYVNPAPDLVMSLSPKARKEIYAPMIAASGNTYSYLLCSCPADRYDEFLSGSGLPDETIALIKKLSYPHGNLVFFCDLPLVMDTLPSEDQKMRLVKTLLRKSTLLLRLHITPDSNVPELEQYWAKAGWGIDVRPLLESLAQQKPGARIDVVELFPPLPSSEIYNFTFPSDKPEDQHKDCRWTAMNFFRNPPDDRFTDSKVVAQTLATDYYPVPSDPRYGDIVALLRSNGDIIHLAVFIADDVVFTKNSANFRDPYMLMRLSDMIDNFSAQIPEDETLRVAIFRNKYY